MKSVDVIEATKDALEDLISKAYDKRMEQATIQKMCDAFLSVCGVKRNDLVEVKYDQEE